MNFLNTTSSGAVVTPVVSPPPSQTHGVIDARLFLYPLNSTQQLTIVEINWPLSLGNTVVIRVPAPASLSILPVIPGLFESLSACFPSTAPTRHAWDDDSGTDERGGGGGDASLRIPSGSLPSDVHVPHGVRAEAVHCDTDAVPIEITAGLSNIKDWAFFSATAATVETSTTTTTASSSSSSSLRASTFFSIEHALIPTIGLWLPLTNKSGGVAKAVRWTAFSAGGLSMEDGGWGNAGASPSESLGALRRRLATGSFRDIHSPTKTWTEIAEQYAFDTNLVLRVRRGAGGLLPTHDVFIQLAHGGGGSDHRGFETPSYTPDGR
jgi:hypothetical protein